MSRRPLPMPEFTMGWELESISTPDSIPEGIVEHEDGSVNGEGREYVLSRDLIADKIAAINALQELTTDPGISVDRSCGFHVHVGLPKSHHRYNNMFAAHFVSLARMVEDAAFDAVPQSRRGSSYCLPWKNNLNGITTRRYYGQKYANRDRYYWVNVVEMFRPHGIGTVEIRLLGNTRRFWYILGWICFCLEMARSTWEITRDPSLLHDKAAQMNSLLVALRRAFITHEIPESEAITRTKNQAIRLGLMRGQIVSPYIAETPHTVAV